MKFIQLQVYSRNYTIYLNLFYIANSAIKERIIQKKAISSFYWKN